MVPSSSGLGRGPLKAATRVRISLGSPIQTAVMKMAAFSAHRQNKGQRIKIIKKYYHQNTKLKIN